MPTLNIILILKPTSFIIGMLGMKPFCLLLIMEVKKKRRRRSNQQRKFRKTWKSG